jgi:predicted DNA-binding transcriptional regulator YafY
MSKQPSLNSTQRIEVLLAVLSNLKRHDVIAVSELAEQLNLDLGQLRQDLETLQYAGVPPFGGGDLLPIELDDEGFLCVNADLPALDQPLRLTGEEAAALTLALRIAGFSTDEPLLRKLAAATTFGFDADTLDQILHIVQGELRPEVFQTLSAALDEGESGKSGAAVLITYVNNRGERSKRIIEPWALFLENGCWYVSAFDEKREAPGNFRIDRISEAQTAGSARHQPQLQQQQADNQRSKQTRTPSVWGSMGNPPLCRICFKPKTAYQSEQWPRSSIKAQTDDTLSLDVPCLDAHWIARKVVALHGQAEVKFPAEVQTAVQEIARQQLEALL